MAVVELTVATQERRCRWVVEKVKRSSLNLDRAGDATAIMYWQEEFTELEFFHKGWMPSCHTLYAEVRPLFPKVLLAALTGIQGIIYCGRIVHEQNKKAP